MVFLLQLDSQKPVLLCSNNLTVQFFVNYPSRVCYLLDNLTKLESRPAREGLGQYCFLLDLEGHIADSVGLIVFKRYRQDIALILGSYPAAGDHAEAVREESNAALDKAADSTLFRSKLS